MRYGLELADGSLWVIAAGDAKAVPVISRLAEKMRLRDMSRTFSHHAGVLRRLLVTVDDQYTEAPRFACYAPLPSDSNGTVQCVLNMRGPEESVYLHAMRLSLVIARETQTRGGVLLHGALAERDGTGVILAAPGGTGKTTASRRLSPPWRSLCDDTTLIIRDPQGGYRAHPWPTWSRYIYGGSDGDGWDVQYSVPLGGIFFLSRADDDHVGHVGTGHAASILVECANQSSMIMGRGMRMEDARSLHIERFNNLCDLARIVPAHMLHISLNGTFWREIEGALKLQPGPT